jgi:hypothetical protein
MNTAEGNGIVLHGLGVLLELQTASQAMFMCMCVCCGALEAWEWSVMSCGYMIFGQHVMISQTWPHPKPRLALPSVSRVNSREVLLQCNDSNVLMLSIFLS